MNFDRMDKEKERADRTLNEGKLLGLVKRRYPSHDYVVLDQVKSDTTNRARTADALVLGLWKSRDLGIEGFEFKASRTDWILELQAPQKAEEVANFCDRWWLVATNDEIVRPDELPKNWGLYLPDKNGSLKVAIQAPALTPKEPDRVFLGCLMRRLLDQKLSETREEDLRKEYERGKIEGKEAAIVQAISGQEHVVEWLHRELYEKTMRLSFLEDRLGTRLGLSDPQMAMWAEIIREVTGRYKASRDPEKIRPLLEAVRFMKDAPVEAVSQKFQLLKAQADEISLWLGSKLESLNLLQKEPPP